MYWQKENRECPRGDYSRSIWGIQARTGVAKGLANENICYIDYKSKLCRLKNDLKIDFAAIVCLFAPLPRPIYKYWDGIFKLLRSPRINSKEWTPPASAALQAGTKTLFLLNSCSPYIVVKFQHSILYTVYCIPSIPPSRSNAFYTHIKYCCGDRGRAKHGRKMHTMPLNTFVSNFWFVFHVVHFLWFEMSAWFRPRNLLSFFTLFFLSSSLLSYWKLGYIL